MVATDQSKKAPGMVRTPRKIPKMFELNELVEVRVSAYENGASKKIRIPARVILVPPEPDGLYEVKCAKGKRACRFHEMYYPEIDTAIEHEWYKYFISIECELPIGWNIDDIRSVLLCNGSGESRDVRIMGINTRAKLAITQPSES